MTNFAKTYNSYHKRHRFTYIPKDSGEMIEVSIGFNEGGINYSTYKTERKGPQLIITAISREVRDGYVSTTSSPFADTNCRIFIKEMPRYSEKKMDSIAATFDDIAPIISENWLNNKEGMIRMIFDKIENL